MYCIYPKVLLKIYLFNKSIPSPYYFFYPGLPSRLRDWTGLMLLYLFLVCFFFNVSVCSVWCTKLMASLFVSF